MPLILIVDDEPAIRALLRQVLERAGHSVIEAEDGVAGLEAARAGRPDVALLDLALPRLNGLELCRSLRAGGASSAPPVLLITGLATASERHAAMAAGAADVIVKPFTPDDVVARVNQALASKLARSF